MSLAPVIAVVGPSGVGKDSVMDALVAQVPGVRRVRRVITRPEGEEGEVFDRVSVDEFRKMEASGEFALSWAANGLHYGVPSSIEDQRRGAQALLVNLSRSVLLQAQEVFGELIVISLTADPAVLAQRLSARARETADEQEKRLGRASVPLPRGLTRVIEIDNSGTLSDTVSEVLAQLQPVRG